MLRLQRLTLLAAACLCCSFSFAQSGTFINQDQVVACPGGTFCSLNNGNNWQYNHDPGTPGSITTMSTALDTVCSPDNLSRRFDISGASSNAGFIAHVSGGTLQEVPNATQFIWTVPFCLSDTSHLVNFEFDMNQIQGASSPIAGQTMIFGVQCDGTSGTWDVTSYSSGSHWPHTDQACPPHSAWTANTRHIFYAIANRDAVGNIYYQGASFDGTFTAFTCSGAPCIESSHAALGWSPDGGFVMNVQQDMDSSTGYAWSLWIDEVSLQYSQDVYFGPSAAGQGTGTDCTDALAYSDATYGWNAALNWNPGATLHVCPGTYGLSANSTVMTQAGNGTAGQSITIHGEPGGELIKEPYFPSAGAFNFQNASYLTIDGGTPCGDSVTACNFVIQASLNGTSGGVCPGGTCTTQNTAIGVNAYNCNNCELKNLGVYDLYDHTSASDTVVDATEVSAIYMGGANVLIHDSRYHDVGWAVAMNASTGSSNDQFYNLEIYRMSHGFAVGAPTGVTISNLFAYNLHLHDLANWGTSGTCSPNPCNAYHLAYFHAFSTGTGKIQNLYLHDSLFDGSLPNCCVTGHVFLEGSASGTPWTDATGTAFLWNNIFTSNVDNSNGIVYIGNGSGHKVINNTIIGPNAGGNGACLVFQTNALLITAENNVMEGCTAAIYGTAGSTYSLIDYNTYANSSGGNPTWQFGANSATTLSAWQAACSCDSHSQAQLGSALANLTSEGVPSAGFIGARWGNNLGTLATGNLASLASDTGAGNTHTPMARPASGTCSAPGSSAICWDTGAYNSPFVPPSNIPVAPASAMFADLNFSALIQ